MSGFQSQINGAMAPGIPGDLASANSNKFTALAGPGGFVAGAAGVYMARFAWAHYDHVDADGAPAIVSNSGAGVPSGFVRRDQTGVITTYLAEASMLIPQGLPVSIFEAGDFWCENGGDDAALYGMKAYAKLTDGTIVFADTGSSIDAVTLTASVEASTFEVTATASDNVLTVSAVTSGTVVVGATVSSDSMVGSPKIVAQLSGTSGGIGTYALDVPGQDISDGETVTGSYGTMTVTAADGTVAVGEVVTGGTGITAGAVVTALGTGTGGTGTYIIDDATAVDSTDDITLETYVETGWTCRSSGASGAVVKISNNG